MTTGTAAVSYSLLLSATSGAVADGSATNTVTATLMSGSTYASGKSVILTITVGSAIFPESGTDTLAVTTNTLGQASVDLTDTEEETVWIKAILLEDTSITVQTSSVFGSRGSTLPAPSVTEATDGVLPYSLTQTHVIVPTSTLTAGDTIQLLWKGTLSDGTTIADYTPNDTVTSVTQDLVFLISSSHIVPLSGGSVDVSYTDITTGDGSDVLHLGVSESDGNWLAAPVVEEASESSLSSSVAQATVNIAPYSGMAAGDIVSLYWNGNTTGEYTLTQTVSGNTAGKTMTFSVPASQIKGNAAVGVNYTVTPFSGADLQVSWPLGLNVI
ncbi:TPA: hypothetical protein ONC18_004471 [Enterobacter kobei]|nr:hypothetical protein [Enterobacter kobei]